MTAMADLRTPAAGFALHAEAVGSDPAALRWVCPEGLPAVGRLVDAPGRLGELLAPGGPIVQALTERAALWTWLADVDAGWSELGPVVRDAIAAAAERPDLWQVEPAPDEVLRLVARDVVERGLGEYIASHGGLITVVRAEGGEVDVALEGACARCPAAGLTLHGRIEAAIRLRVDDRVVVRPSVGRESGQHDDRRRFGRWSGLL